jgi:membrane protein implicated in regulation of membrane protease activity
MCHLVLIGLPLLALASFWVLPWTLAVPASIALVAAALLFYGYLVKAAHRPVMTGIEALQHALGRVRSVQGNIASIWVNSELWSARIVEGLRQGDKVEVVGVDGLLLRVRKLTRDINEPGRYSS